MCANERNQYEKLDNQYIDDEGAIYETFENGVTGVAKVDQYEGGRNNELCQLF